MPLNKRKVLPFLFLTLFSFCCLSQTPERIVSLSPVTTEYLFALGLGESVIGVTKFCDRPKKANSITKIGGFMDPQLEAIIKLKPTLVVGTLFGGSKSVLDQLNNLKIATVADNAETLGDVKKLFSAIAKATNTISKANILQKNFETEFVKLKGSLSHLKKKVIWLVSASPIVSAGPATFPGEILAHLGLENAVTNTTVKWPVLSLEVLLKSPPDIIIVSEGPPAQLSFEQLLKPLLVKHPHIRLLTPKRELLQRPGPYILEEINEFISTLQRPNA